MTDGIWSLFYPNCDEKTVQFYVPEEPGVYLLWQHQIDRTWKCFYVGKAENLRARFLDHLSIKEENDCLNEMIRYTITLIGIQWVEFHDALERSGVEAFLYEVFQHPKCNLIKPTGISLSIPLPPVPPSM